MSADLQKLAAFRRAQMEKIFIPTARTAAAHESFQFLIEHAEAGCSEKHCVLLVAPSQSGKTKVVEKFVQQKNTPELLAKKKIPVLHVTLHAEVTRKGLAQDILIALSESGSETAAMKGSEAELWERVYRYLASAEVKLLILDEIHHVKTTSQAMARSVGECIKHALLKGPCPIVLSGIHSAELPFRANEQLQQRAIPSIELPRFRPDAPSDLSMFIEFLAAYLVRLEELNIARNAGALLEGDVPGCILEVSGGVLGAACRLIMQAVTNMTVAGRDELSRDDLIKATDDAFVRSGLTRRNPFVAGPSPVQYRREHQDAMGASIG